MSLGKTSIRQNRAEEGQNIVLVAVSLFAILSMAALAIDVTTLYVASTESQQAADAAALAGAKVFVTSGYTSYPAGFGTTDWVCNGSNGLADYAAQSAVATNTVSGAVPTITTSCDFTHPENPRITVVVQRSALPVFFARIWGASAPTTSSTATAEAYNPSGGSVPVGASVKPWLLPNCNPLAPVPGNAGNPNCNGGAYDYFVDPTNGSIHQAASFIGQTITLTVGNGNISGGKLLFYPLDLPLSPAPLCPSTSTTWCSNNPGIYYDGIACLNQTRLSCGQSVNGPSDPVYVDSRMNNGGFGNLKARTDQGTQCLIHASGNGTGQGQDGIISQGVGEPVLFQPGANNPNPSLAGSQYVSRSDSVITVPLFDGSNICGPTNKACSQVTATNIVGFLQLGIIDYPSSGSGTIDAYILNASGCNPGASGTPISGGNISPIPVRLIQTP